MEKLGLKKCKVYFNLMLVMICSFVGVGFVSGAEIYEFFVRFGSWCYLGIFVFYLLCFLLVYKILVGGKTKQISLDLKVQNKSENYNNFYSKTHNNLKNNSKNTILNKNNFRQLVVFLNVFLISGAMFSGLKNLLYNLFFNNYFILLIICFFVAFLITLIGVKGLEKVDLLVMLFVGVIIACFVADYGTGRVNDLTGSASEFNDGKNAIEAENGINFKFAFLSIIFSLLYVFMNILQFEPLVRQSGISFTKKRAFCFSACFSILLSAVLLIFVIFLKSNISLGETSMPFLTYFASRGGVMSKIFSFGLLICLVTTLITCLIGTKTHFKMKYNLKSFGATSLALTIAILAGLLPFNFYVSVIYPILGAINFITLVLF